MKNILVIQAHPDKGSFVSELAQRYAQAAMTAGADCHLVHLADLTFDLSLKNGYKQPTELEPDLVTMQEKISLANHLVFVYPTWWGTYPALLKGFIDRIFLPGFAFKYRKDSLFWDKLLNGKSARLITTMDTPGWYYKLIYRSPGHNSLKHSILEFCGVKPVKITSFRPIKTSNLNQREKWLREVENLGKRLE